MKKANDYIMQAEMFLSGNPLVTMCLYFLGFFTSGYVTFLALSATSVSYSSQAVWGSYTVVMEFGKAISYLQYIKTKKPSFSKMWLILTFFSIASSMAFMVIENNITENKTKNSGIYLDQTKGKETRLINALEIAKNDKVKAQQEKSTATSSLSQEKLDIAKQIETYNKNIKSNQSKIDAENIELQRYISKGFWDRKSASEAKISQLKENIRNDVAARDKLKPNDNTEKSQTTIEKSEAEIKRIEGELNNIDYSSLPQEKATAGFYALFQFFGAGPRFIFWLEFVFTLALTTTFEVLICMLYSLSKTGHLSPIITEPDPEKKNKPKIEIEIPEQKTPKKIENLGGNSQKPVTVFRLKKGEKIPSPKQNSLGLEKNLGKIEEQPKETPKEKQVIEPTPSNVSSFKPRLVENLKTPPKKPKIETPKSGIEKDIQIYLEFAVKNTKVDGDFPSRADMAKGTAFSQEKCRTIHNTLKSRGVINTSTSPKRRTWLVKDANVI